MTAIRRHLEIGDLGFLKPAGEAERAPRAARRALDHPEQLTRIEAIAPLEQGEKERPRHVVGRHVVIAGGVFREPVIEMRYAGDAGADVGWLGAAGGAGVFVSGALGFAG